MRRGLFRILFFDSAKRINVFSRNLRSICLRKEKTRFLQHKYHIFSKKIQFVNKKTVKTLFSEQNRFEKIFSVNQETTDATFVFCFYVATFVL